MPQMQCGTGALQRQFVTTQASPQLSQKESLVHTLCFILTPARVLLGQKKRGFGVGKWNGYGGKIEEGETAEQAVKREVYEEVGLEVEVTPRGFVKAQGLSVHLFTSRQFKGIPIETDEMNPQWFLRTAIPWNQMWESDRLWLPKLLKGEWVDEVIS